MKKYFILNKSWMASEDEWKMLTGVIPADDDGTVVVTKYDGSVSDEEILGRLVRRFSFEPRQAWRGHGSPWLVCYDNENATYVKTDKSSKSYWFALNSKSGYENLLDWYKSGELEERIHK